VPRPGARIRFRVCERSRARKPHSGDGGVPPARRESPLNEGKVSLHAAPALLLLPRVARARLPRGGGTARGRAARRRAERPGGLARDGARVPRRPGRQPRGVPNEDGAARGPERADRRRRASWTSPPTGAAC
jgi:hypothetical protein